MGGGAREPRADRPTRLGGGAPRPAADRHRKQSPTRCRLPTPPPPPLAVAARLLITAVLLLRLVIGTGLLITRVGAGSDVEKADTATVRWLAGERTETLDAVSGPAAEMGNTWVVIGVALVAAVLAVAVLRRWRLALVFAVALVGELAIFLTTTAVIDRPRPPVAHLDAQLPPTSSFPSGHTAAAICLYGAIAALALALTRAWWRWLILTIAVLVIVAVAVARLYRGATSPPTCWAAFGSPCPGCWSPSSYFAHTPAHHRATAGPRSAGVPGCTTPQPIPPDAVCPHVLRVLQSLPVSASATRGAT